MIVWWAMMRRLATLNMRDEIYIATMPLGWRAMRMRMRMWRDER